MTKFGLFDGKKSEPVEVWKGDYMNLAKGYVTIYKRNPIPSTKDIAIIVMRLRSGFSVREID
ncbi:MAG TPA: hypothetical protein VIH56_03240 [Candidatus Acidoferrales bacterium]